MWLSGSGSARIAQQPCFRHHHHHTHVRYDHLSARILAVGFVLLLTTFTWNWWAMREEKKCIQFNSVTQPAQMSISHMFLRLLNRKVLIMRRGWRTSAWAQAHRTADDTAADISNSWVKSLPSPPPLSPPFRIWHMYMRAGYTLISIPPVPMGGITWKFSAYSTTVGSFGLPSRNITERRGLFEGNLLIASWAPVFVVSSFACCNILFFFKRVYIRRRREGRIFLAPKKRKKKRNGSEIPACKAYLQPSRPAASSFSFVCVFHPSFFSLVHFTTVFYLSLLASALRRERTTFAAWLVEWKGGDPGRKYSLLLLRDVKGVTCSMRLTRFPLSLSLPCKFYRFFLSLSFREKNKHTGLWILWLLDSSQKNFSVRRKWRER